MKSLQLLIVEDDTAAQYGYKHFFAKNNYQTTCAGTLKEARTILSSERFDAILLDLQLPDGNSIEWIPELKISHPAMPIIIITGVNDIPTAVNAIKIGAENFLTKPVILSNLLVLLERCIELGSMRKRDNIQQRLSNQNAPYFGQSKATEKIIQQAKIAAGTDAVVLLTGETGTGKGVLARLIHDTSERKSEAFIEINCSGLKGDLMSSELFGHTRGAFTSAVTEKQGLVELADGGTLFFDEIGDMSIEVQAQLLKTIEEKSFRRIGDPSLRKSDFRLICATNRDLRKETKEFRRDLYYRISTFPIRLPPLRERQEEIFGLSEYLLTSLGYTQFPLDSDVLNLLTTYSWPGNTRELKNVLERALLIAQGTPLALRHFSDLSEQLTHEEPLKLDVVEDVHILEILEKFNGDKKKASMALGISISSLYRRLSKCLNSTENEQFKSAN